MIVIDMDIPKSCSECPLINICPRNENIHSTDCLIRCDIEDIKAEIQEETECRYGDKCLGANCPSNTDCMIMGEHAIWIIDRHIGERSKDAKNSD